MPEILNCIAKSMMGSCRIPKLGNRGVLTQWTQRGASRPSTQKAGLMLCESCLLSFNLGLLLVFRYQAPDVGVVLIGQRAVMNHQRVLSVHSGALGKIETSGGQ